MTVKELKTGMFGMMSDGEVFVVAGDKLIYEGGQYNNIADMSEDMQFADGDCIVALFEARCFGQVNDGRAKVIWERPDEDEVEEEVHTTPEGAVTITEDEFFEAVKKANELFFEVGKEVPGSDGLPKVIMGLQNITFGAVVGAVLFGKEIN
jgi:hypothetical protein